MAAASSPAASVACCMTPMLLAANVAGYMPLNTCPKFIFYETTKIATEVSTIKHYIFGIVWSMFLMSVVGNFHLKSKPKKPPDQKFLINRAPSLIMLCGIILSIAMLSVIVLSIAMLSVIMLSLIMLKSLW